MIPTSTRRQQQQHQQFGEGSLPAFDSVEDWESTIPSHLVASCGIGKLYNLVVDDDG